MRSNTVLFIILVIIFSACANKNVPDTNIDAPDTNINVPDTEQKSETIMKQRNTSWQQAIEKSERRVEYEQVTYCDTFVRYVLVEYGINDFNGRRIPQFYEYLKSHWIQLQPEEAAKKAEDGIPTVALTTNSDLPGNHIVVLTGGMDNRNRPCVKGSGTFSGPSGESHKKRPGKKYLGYVYENLGNHWRKSHFKYIKYFSRL